MVKDSKRVSKGKKVKSAYDKVFSSPEGKTVLFDLMDATGFMAPSMDYSRPEAVPMAFNDGAKSIVHRIIHQLHLDPEKYLEIVETKQLEDNFEI